MKDYSGTYEENVKLHGKKKANEIGDARIKLYLRNYDIEERKKKAVKEHEQPHWGKGD